MKRTRAYRRHQEKRVERRRYESNYHRWIKQQAQAVQGVRNITVGPARLEPYGAEWTARFRRQLRSGNGSCGCVMCKPWKHGARWDYPVKKSERCRLDSVKDKSQPEEPDDGDLEGKS